jgi:pyruvate kinase
MVTKKTKIIATVSDLNAGPEFLKKLYEAGMNAVRLNTAHMNIDNAHQVVANIRAVSQRLPIIIDTKGPEVRTAGLEAPLPVKTGDTVILYDPRIKAPAGVPCFTVNYNLFIEEMRSGVDILIDDGDLSLTVTEKKPDGLTLRVNNDGQIKNRKSINVPEIHLNLPSLTDRDREFIDFACDAGIDFIAHSFVRNREDVLEVKKILDARNSRIGIIAKIENLEGVQKIEEILDHADGVMVARGDMGIELPAEDVPLVQKQLIKACIRRAKPVITATQMLHSMIDNPRPTRAEVSDVANAILDGTDAIMLSGETAYGKYPVEAVEMMTSIARKIEDQEKLTANAGCQVIKNPVRHQLIKCAIDTAAKLQAKAIVVHTNSGRSARILSSYRCNTPTKALCLDNETVRQLALSYGVEAYRLDSVSTISQLVELSCVLLLWETELKTDDTVVMVAGDPGKAVSSNFIEVGTISLLSGSRSGG